jgi:hypothetical protein
MHSNAMFAQVGHYAAIMPVPLPSKTPKNKINILCNITLEGSAVQ